VTSRKKKLLLIQISMFFIATSLLYFPYRNTSNTEQETKSQNTKVLEADTNLSNKFENVEYKGIDLNGNRYVVKSSKAIFAVENPELVNMEVMNTIFYFKDGSTVKIDGDYGSYNNKNKNMKFRENVRVVRETSFVTRQNNDYVYADNLDYLNSEGMLTIYGNVRTESIEGNIAADNIKINLKTEIIDISMFGQKKVNVKLKGE